MMKDTAMHQNIRIEVAMEIPLSDVHGVENPQPMVTECALEVCLGEIIALIPVDLQETSILT